MKNLLIFVKKSINIILFVVLELIAITIISNNNEYQGSKIQAGVVAATGQYYSFINNTFNYFYLKKNNNLLQEENRLLKLYQTNNFFTKDKLVFSLNDTVYRQKYEYINAHVISNSVNKKNNYIWLDKGSDDGIEPDMAVISSAGIVGIVQNVSNNFSSVMSLLHSEAKISAKILRTNVIGTIQWEGANASVCNLNDIPANFDIQAGDSVVATGYALHFPEGIMIGTVISTSKNSFDDFLNTKIALTTNFHTISNVYVVVNLNKHEQDELMTKQNSHDE